MALTEARLTDEREGRQFYLDVAASTEIFAGSLVSRDAAGRAIPAAATAGTIVVGFAPKGVDNSAGSAGDEKVLVKRGMAAHFANGAAPNAITIAEIGTAAYVADGGTVRKFNADLTNIPVGRIIDLDDDGVWVVLGDYATNTGDNITVTDAAITGDAAVTGDATIGGTLGVTGVLTATGGVVGDVTGNVTGAVTGNADTATTAVLAETVTYHEEDNATAAPTNAEMAAAFDGDENVGIFFDTDAGNAGAGAVAYLCSKDSNDAWHYVAMTAGA